MTLSFGERLEQARRAMTTVCVTGTNGKTTTTSMIEAIVAASGEAAARVTTLGAWVGGEQVAAEATSDAFLDAMERAAARGVKTAAIETTSQALAEGFAAMWPARVAVFTNLSRDHLDYHGTPEDYLAAKAQLFMRIEAGGVAVLNAADPSSALLDEVTPPGVSRRGYAARAVDGACVRLPLTLEAEQVSVSRAGTRIRLAGSRLGDALGRELALRVLGEVHAENALGAAVAADALGYASAAIRAGLEGFAGVPGRFQLVLDRPLVVVDFAHTPDALERTLSLARSLVAADGGRVVCVFGCGGERDQGKRAEMGRVAGRSAEVVVLTSDNPRSEDPEAILRAILEGTAGTPASVERELDRAVAIRRGIELASPYDIVVIAGKGHEQTQIWGKRALPFDDVAVVRAVGRAGPSEGDLS